MARFKKILKIIYENLIIIFNGSFLFILMFSGLICAIILRTLGFNGWIIATLSVLVEIIAVILSYSHFRRYFGKEEKKIISDQKGKKL